MTENLKPWFVTEPGGPMGQWPGVMERGGRIIAFAVPDVTTAKELVTLRAQLAERTEAQQQLQMALHVRDTQLAAASTETTEQAWEIAKLRYYVEALERLATPEERQTAVDEASIALAKHNPPEWVKEKAVTWIPVAERLPEPDLRVLAVYSEQHRRTIIRALYLPHKYASCCDGYEEAVYDEETDQLYYPGGWYEAVQEQEYAFYGPLPCKVTHWANLPALPDCH